MSEQITVVLPRASTADNLRTTALRRAIRCTPKASATVTMAGIPSGMAPTARLTPVRRVFSRLLPCARLITEMAPTEAITSRVIFCPTHSIRRCSGVISGSTPLSRPAIFPISVFIPVATMIAVALPEMMLVPENTMFF
ncbi:MAG: hypothetical protein BWY80_00527 [Firmicutes bacterium ADurb.Bin456]|nr:MAG: hypothetical protein BWY80_00527 [Firmicutes bacterium ADurb.Bin456]